jgi:hypothetical protein
VDDGIHWFTHASHGTSSKLRRSRALGSPVMQVTLASLHDSRVGSWALAFALTQLVEVPIWMRAFPKPMRALKAFGATAITHPLLWFVFVPMWRGDWWTMFVVGELLVVAIESAYARALGVKRPLAWSFVANGASAGLGLLLYSALGWM